MVREDGATGEHRCSPAAGVPLTTSCRDRARATCDARHGLLQVFSHTLPFNLERSEGPKPDSMPGVGT